MSLLISLYYATTCKKWRYTEFCMSFQNLRNKIIFQIIFWNNFQKNGFEFSFQNKNGDNKLGTVPVRQGTVFFVYKMTSSLRFKFNTNLHFPLWIWIIFQYSSTYLHGRWKIWKKYAATFYIKVAAFNITFSWKSMKMCLKKQDHHHSMLIRSFYLNGKLQKKANFTLENEIFRYIEPFAHHRVDYLQPPCPIQCHLTLNHERTWI